MSNTDFRKLQQNTSFKELSRLIIEAIEEEQFFNKETLIPKVKAILSGFKMNINATKYGKIESPSDAARRIRAIEQYEVTVNYWKNRCKDNVPDMQPFYDKLDNILIEKGFRVKKINNQQNEKNYL